MSRRRFTVLLALIPAIALSLAIPFANRVEPRVMGLPFLMAWIVVWWVLTPLFLWFVYRMGART